MHGVMSTGRHGGCLVEIPASTKKAVQDLKEVVSNSEEEIYAMIKECNMEPNETAQRLLNEGGIGAAAFFSALLPCYLWALPHRDPFHEVKRKRDKKKDSGVLKEGADVRQRPGSGGNFGRGGGRGGGDCGRGILLSRFGSQENCGDRGRRMERENGSHSSSRGSTAVSNSSFAHNQVNPLISSRSIPPSSTTEELEALETRALNIGSGILSVVANVSSGYLRPAPAPQGAWTSRHGRIAEIVKARPAPPLSIQALSGILPSPESQASVNSLYPEAELSTESSDASEFCSSSVDLELRPVDLRNGRAPGTIETVGHQRPFGDRLVSTSSIETGLGTGAASGQTIFADPSAVSEAPVESRGAGAQVEVGAGRPASPLYVPPPVSSKHLNAEEAGASMNSGSGQAQQAGGRSVSGGRQYHGQPLQIVAGAGNVGLKGKGLGQNSERPSSDVNSQSLGASDPTMIVQSCQALSLQVEEPVIIPIHFRVPEADCSHLSFGSFGSDSSTDFRTSYGQEEVEKIKHVEAIAAEDLPLEQPATASMETQVEMVQLYGHHQELTAVENMRVSVGVASVGHQGPAVAALEHEQLKLEPGLQQSAAYFRKASNLLGIRLMSQMPGGQHGYEQAKSQGQDMSLIPSMVPAYDPTSSYYTSAFRGADADHLYPPYAPTNTSNKYTGDMGLMTAPSLPSSQEALSPIMVSAGPSSQAGSKVQSAQTIPHQQGLQQLPMHFSQAPSGQFGNFVGYQYVPQNYPYLQPPYPHYMYSSSSNAYAQVPAGASYLPTADSSYPSCGITSVKFAVPQYKPKSEPGNPPTSDPGIEYGRYKAIPGYRSNVAVSAGKSFGYEDVTVSRYKNSTLYIPGEQGDSSTVWIPTSMLRDMGPLGSMQTSSYYNLANQGQHDGYALHSQQPMHGHAHPNALNAAYANLYHPSQAGLLPNHQMLQQSQSMGVGFGNTQAGAYQQPPQRTQQTWNSSNF